MKKQEESLMMAIEYYGDYFSIPEYVHNEIASGKRSYMEAGHLKFEGSDLILIPQNKLTLSP